MRARSILFCFISFDAWNICPIGAASNKSRRIFFCFVSNVMFMNRKGRPFHRCPFQLTQSIYNQISVMDMILCSSDHETVVWASNTNTKWVISHYCAWHQNSLIWLMTVVFILLFWSFHRVCVCVAESKFNLSQGTRTMQTCMWSETRERQNQWRFTWKLFLILQLTLFWFNPIRSTQ